MFGFKLIRRSKIDESEVESFRKILPMLTDSVQTLENFATDTCDVDSGEIDIIEYRKILDNLESLFRVYRENKFSYPSCEIDISFELQCLEEAGKLLCETFNMREAIRDSMKIPKDVSFTEACEAIISNTQPEDSDKNEKLVNDLSRMLFRMEQANSQIATSICRTCVRIRRVIGSDEARIRSGRDIIQDFYDRKRARNHQGPNMASYTIQIKQEQSKPKRGQERRKG